jgi:hypothetical protein
MCRVVREQLWSAAFLWSAMPESITRLCHEYGAALGSAPECILYALLAIVPVLAAGMRVAAENPPALSEALHNFVVIAQPSGAAKVRQCCPYSPP